MAQSPKGRSIQGLSKPIHGNCAIYFYPGCKLLPSYLTTCKQKRIGVFPVFYRTCSLTNPKYDQDYAGHACCWMSFFLCMLHISDLSVISFLVQRFGERVHHPKDRNSWELEVGAQKTTSDAMCIASSPCSNVLNRLHVRHALWLNFFTPQKSRFSPREWLEVRARFSKGVG